MWWRNNQDGTLALLFATLCGIKRDHINVTALHCSFTPDGRRIDPFSFFGVPLFWRHRLRIVAFGQQFFQRITRFEAGLHNQAFAVHGQCHGCNCSEVKLI